MTVTIRYLGISGFEIRQEGGMKIVIDPFLIGNGEMEIPPSPIAIEELLDADAVIVTHGAYDHLGQAIEIAGRGNAILCCGPDVRIHALREGLSETKIAKMISGCVYTQGDLRIKTLDARHISFFESHGTFLSGQPLSYMLEIGNEPRVYHSGDTSLYGDLKLYGELYRPDIALLCVGAAEKDLAPLPPDDAAVAADWLNASLVIPMHFRPGAREPEEFKSIMALKRPDISVMQLDPGQEIRLPEQD